MMPTQKAKEIDDFLTSMTGISRQDAATKRVCTWCKNPVANHSFRDVLSAKEYRISGFCQKCQDDTFGVE